MWSGEVAGDLFAAGRHATIFGKRTAPSAEVQPLIAGDVAARGRLTCNTRLAPFRGESCVGNASLSTG